IPVIMGARTAREAAIATQASAELPPFSSVLIPVSAASGCSQATAPLDPKTVERPPDPGRRTVYLLMPFPHVSPETSFTVYIGSSRGTVAQLATKEVRFGSGKADLRRRHVALYPDLAFSLLEREAGGGDLRRPLGPDGAQPGPVPRRRGGVATPSRTRGATPRTLYALLAGAHAGRL